MTTIAKSYAGQWSDSQESESDSEPEQACSALVDAAMWAGASLSLVVAIVAIFI